MVQKFLNREKLAKRLSDIFNPYYASAPFFLIVVAGSSPDFAAGIVYFFITVLFFSVLPVWDIHRRIKFGLVTDAHISRREDRIKPFLFSLGCAVAGLATIHAIGAPVQIQAVSWTVVLTGAVITAITAFWKISLHAAAISSIVVALVALYGPYMLLTSILVPVVAWARLTLKKHSVGQILAGISIAVVIAVAVFRKFGLI